MNLQDPTLNPADPCPSCDRPGIPGRPACDGCPDFNCEWASGEPAIVIGGREYSIETLGKAKGIELRIAFDKLVAASRHNADLLEALEDGTDFTVSFRKPGKSAFTRVRFEDQEPLQAAAIEEIGLRQTVSMTNLADLLGVDNFTLTNI